MQVPEGKREADLLYGLFSISLTAELWNFIYVFHCMWPFVDLTHFPKHSAKHLLGTKDFMWCRKATEAALHLCVVDRNLSGSKKQNHTLYLLKPCWLMWGFMLGVEVCTSLLKTCFYCSISQFYTSLWKRGWYLIQESLGILWRLPWESET